MLDEMLDWYTNWNGHMKFLRKILNMKSLKVLIFLKVNQITIYCTIKFEHIFRSCVLGLLVWSVMKKHCFKLFMIVKFFWKASHSFGYFHWRKKWGYLFWDWCWNIEIQSVLRAAQNGFLAIRCFFFKKDFSSYHYMPC